MSFVLLFYERHFRQNANCSSSGLVYPSETQGHHNEWVRDSVQFGSGVEQNSISPLALETNI